MRQAVWLDRAEAVVAQLETISLRELRATVLGASPRDEHGRELLGTIREALKARLAKLRDGWEGDINRALADGRVLHTLRLSARPPDPGARIPGSLVVPLSVAAGAGLSAASSVDRWLVLLEAAAASPVRRSIKPAGLPDDPSGADAPHGDLGAGRLPALIAAGRARGLPPPPRPVPARPTAQAAKGGVGPAPRRRRGRRGGWRNRRSGASYSGRRDPTVFGDRGRAPADDFGTSPTGTTLTLVVEQAQLVAGDPASRSRRTNNRRATSPSPAESDRSPQPGDESPGTLGADADPQVLDPEPSSDDRLAPEPTMTAPASADGDAVVPEPLAEAVNEV